MTMDRCSSAAAASSGASRTAVTSVAACRSAASIRRATAWVRLRTLSWFAGEAGSKVSRIRAASRNEVRAPNSACTRSSSGVQRAVSSAQTGENSTPVMGTGWRQRQTLNRGAFDLDRAEQGLQPARAPVLERLQHPACRTDPVVGRIRRHLAAQHARLQPGQKRLALVK